MIFILLIQIAIMTTSADTSYEFEEDFNFISQENGISSSIDNVELDENMASDLKNEVIQTEKPYYAQIFDKILKKNQIKNKEKVVCEEPISKNKSSKEIYRGKKRSRRRKKRHGVSYNLPNMKVKRKIHAIIKEGLGYPGRQSFIEKYVKKGRDYSESTIEEQYTKKMLEFMRLENNLMPEKINKVISMQQKTPSSTSRFNYNILSEPDFYPLNIVNSFTKNGLNENNEYESIFEEQ